MKSLLKQDNKEIKLILYIQTISTGCLGKDEGNAYPTTEILKFFVGVSSAKKKKKEGKKGCSIPRSIIELTVVQDS